MTPRATQRRKWESWLRYVLAAGYHVDLGAESLLTGHPIATGWLAWKALLFGFIFVAAIMIDVSFKPVGGLLGRLLAEGIKRRNRAAVATRYEPDTHLGVVRLPAAFGHRMAWCGKARLTFFA